VTLSLPSNYIEVYVGHSNKRVGCVGRVLERLFWSMRCCTLLASGEDGDIYPHKGTVVTNRASTGRGGVSWQRTIGVIYQITTLNLCAGM
jgi:hypothetical protein